MSKPTPEVPAFSRGGRSCILGKRTVPLHTKVSEETAEELRKLAHEAGMSISEFTAEVLMVRAHGPAEMERLLRDRLAVVSGLARE